MDTVRSDDFAGLLAALGRAPPTPAPPTFAPPPMQPSTSFAAAAPMMYTPQFGFPPQQYWQPSFAPPPAVELEPKKGMNPWVVGGLLVAVLLCAVIAWMRMTSMQAKEESEDEEEEEYKVKSAPREVPPPSTAVPLKEEEDAADNLLRYVKEYAPQDEFDISGQELPLEYVLQQPEKSSKPVKKRIVADESDEVTEYAKRRDALFKEK